MKKRPNVLFLISDEHRASIAGFEGDNVVRTPVLDSLAASGVIFKNAYTPAPVCVPARQAMVSGQFPSTCGCRMYGDDLSPGYMTFARRFSQYGYRTTACGILHHMGYDQMQGWTHRIGADMMVDSRYVEDKFEGFEDVVRRKGDPKWSIAKEIKRAGIANGSSYQSFDEYTVKGALNFIENYFNDSYYDREETDRPVMLYVGLQLPHYPFLAEESKFKYYLNRVKPYLNQQISDHPILNDRLVRPGVDVTQREIQRAIAAYYANVEKVDEYYGMIIKALEYVGQDLDDWIIIYTSDHGDMLGEHGIWEKFSFYEGSVRVPLIIRWPNKFEGGRLLNENVNLCDIFATLCDLSEIPTPPGLDSRSLVPLLKGSSQIWDNETISQYSSPKFESGIIMIKRNHLKYLYCGSNMPEVLFDLERDPKETVNYYDHPAYEMELQAFRQRRTEFGYGK